MKYVLYEYLPTFEAARKFLYTLFSYFYYSSGNLKWHIGAGVNVGYVYASERSPSPGSGGVGGGLRVKLERKLGGLQSRSEHWQKKHRLTPIYRMLI
jgi:hypothetical protein